MDTITLRYGQQAKPIPGDCNAEAGVGNWVGHGNHAISSSSDYAGEGLRSFKVVASGVGDFAANYVGLPLGNNSNFGIGIQYEVTLWAFSVLGGSIQLKTGGVTSGITALTAGVPTMVKTTFVGVTSVTEFQLIMTGAGTFYFDKVTITQYTNFRATILRGLDYPDETVPATNSLNDYLDGSSETQFSAAFIRKIEVKFAVFTDLPSAEALMAWVFDNNRLIDFGSEVDLSVSPQTTGEFKSIWLYGAKCNRYYDFNLMSASPILAWPSLPVQLTGGFGYDFGYDFGDQL
jgi:hypothetical protein